MKCSDPQPSDTPKSTPDRRELVEWMAKHHADEIFDEAYESGYALDATLKDVVADDAFMRKFFPDDRIVARMEADQEGIADKRAGL